MSNQQKIENAGLNYDNIIFHDDILPSRIYYYQIKKRNDKITQLVHRSAVALDVGCGTGFHTEELMKKFNYVISTDISFNAVKNAKRKIQSNNESKVEFLVCDAFKIPLIDNSVNTTWISGVLHHIPEKIAQCINDISRITRNQVLLDEPNKIFLWNIIMRLSKADPVGNEIPLDANNIINELRKNNFKEISVSYWGFLVQFALLLKIDFLVEFLEKIENKLENSLGRKFYLRWTINAKKNQG